MSKNREQRAVDQFSCPTCKAQPGHACVGRDGKVMLSGHGPGCHPLRRKLLATINRVTAPEDQPS